MMITGLRLTFSQQALVAVLFLSASVGFSQKASREKQLGELAEAERAFAAFTVKEGFREGFIKFFADDGIGFGPHPERTREKLMKTPPAAGPRKVIFNWAPMFGDIAEAGDLGYTTGPVLFTDVTDPSKPAKHAIYFSVWQKQPDGSWKVAIDMGVDTPEAVAPIDTKFTAAQPVGPRRNNPMRGTPGDDYRTLDWSLWSAIAKTTPGGAYGSRLNDQFRVHRKGLMPMTDARSLSAVTNKQTKFEIIDGKISLSGDLAFSYGKYSNQVEPDPESGYYVHVWRRDADSKWRLVVEVQNPLPRSDK